MKLVVNGQLCLMVEEHVAMGLMVMHGHGKEHSDWQRYHQILAPTVHMVNDLP